jgi:hypothetical protein
MGIDPANHLLPEPDGELEFVPMRIDVAAETAAALQRRVDLKLARCLCALQMKINALLQPTIIPARGKHPRGMGSGQRNSSAGIDKQDTGFHWVRSS